jgi:hypothetical protein
LHIYKRLSYLSNPDFGPGPVSFGLFCKLTKLFNDPLGAFLLGGGAILKLGNEELLVGGGEIAKEDCCDMVVGLCCWPSGRVDTCGWDEEAQGFGWRADGDVVDGDHGLADMVDGPVLDQGEVFVEDQPTGWESGLVWLVVVGESTDDCRGFDCG